MSFFIMLIKTNAVIDPDSGFTLH